MVFPLIFIKLWQLSGGSFNASLFPSASPVQLWCSCRWHFLSLSWHWCWCCGPMSIMKHSGQLSSFPSLLSLLLLLSLLSRGLFNFSLILSWNIVGDTCGCWLSGSFHKYYGKYSVMWIPLRVLGIYSWTRELWTQCTGNLHSRWERHIENK